MAAKDRTLDHISRGNAEFACGTGDHLKDSANGSPGGNGPVGARFGIFGDPHDPAVAGNEDHVERDISVVHPEGDRLILFKIEQHAVAFRQFLAKHEAAGSLGLRGRKLNAKRMHAALADDVERALTARLNRDGGEKGRRYGNEEDRGTADSGAKDADRVTWTCS